MAGIGVGEVLAMVGVVKSAFRMVDDLVHHEAIHHATIEYLEQEILNLVGSFEADTHHNIRNHFSGLSLLPSFKSPAQFFGVVAWEADHDKTLSSLSSHDSDSSGPTEQYEMIAHEIRTIEVEKGIHNLRRGKLLSKNEGSYHQSTNCLGRTPCGVLKLSAPKHHMVRHRARIRTPWQLAIG